MLLPFSHLNSLIFSLSRFYSPTDLYAMKLMRRNLGGQVCTRVDVCFKIARSFFLTTVFFFLFCVSKVTVCGEKLMIVPSGIIPLGGFKAHRSSVFRRHRFFSATFCFVYFCGVIPNLYLEFEGIMVPLLLLEMRGMLSESDLEDEWVGVGWFLIACWGLYVGIL